MRIDINAFVGNYPFRRLEYGDPKRLVSLMDKCEIDFAVVSNFEGVFYRDCLTANEVLTEQIADYRDRLIPCAVLNPTFPRAIEDIERVAEMGMRGIRLFPGYHQYGFDDASIGAFLDKARELNLPIFVYSKLVDHRFRHWLDPVWPLEGEQLSHLLDQASGNTIVFCHTEIAEIESVLSKADLSKNRVYIETSRLERWPQALPEEMMPLFFTENRWYRPLDYIAHRYGAERLLFGSFAPFKYPQAALRLIDLTPLEESTREKILGANAEALLGSKLALEAAR